MQSKNDDLPFLQDKSQNFWQLACIQSAAQSIPVILFGEQLARKVGAGSAISSICIGNLILWLIGLTIISMSATDRRNAIENVRYYLGKKTSIFTALILMAAFLTWYAIEIRSVSNALNELLYPQEKIQDGLSIWWGALFGFVTALLALGGIRIIKWINVTIFPFLLFYILFAITLSEHFPNFDGTWTLSFSGILSVTALTLPGFVNLPTFFRHSRSKADSFFALTLITLFGIFFTISSIFIGIADLPEFFIKHNTTPHIEKILFLTVLFIMLSMVCLNVVNIYFASAAWEAIIRRSWGSLEYFIVGICGTGAYFLFQNKPLWLLLNVLNSSISCLGAVLLMTFLTTIIIKHRTRPYEKFTGTTCWLIGSIAAIFTQEQYSYDGTQTLIISISSSLLLFILIILIEETAWSIDKLQRSRKHAPRK